MGLRGPPPTPTSILSMRGSRLVEGRENEPIAPKGRPKRPAWLTPRGKRIWNSLVPMLEEMGVLTKIDGRALGRYCKLFDRWLTLEAFIDKYGHTFTVTKAGADGKLEIVAVKKYPQVAMALGIVAQLGKLEQQFGMTPAWRAGLQVEKTKTDDVSNFARKREA